MKAFIWMILEAMFVVFGIFAFGFNPEIVMAVDVVTIIILAVTYFVCAQFAEKKKFCLKFVKMFTD